MSFFTLSSAVRTSGTIRATSGFFCHFSAASLLLEVAIQSPTQTKGDNKHVDEDKNEGTDNGDDDDQDRVVLLLLLISAGGGRFGGGGGQSDAGARAEQRDF